MSTTNDAAQQTETITPTNNEAPADDADDETRTETDTKAKAKKCMHVNKIKKKMKVFKAIACDKCDTFNIDERLVFCLTCNKLSCARDTANQHGLSHFVGSQHPLCVSIPTHAEFTQYPKKIILEMLTIWCYKCDLFLHETEQDNTDKLLNMKYQIYGALERGYKKITQNAQQQQDSNKKSSVSPNVNTKKNKNKKDKYAQFKNKHNAQIENRRSVRTTGGDNVSEQAVEKWSELHPHFVHTIRDHADDGYIGIFGLSNLGNTCFFNSIVQNLAETRPLIQSLTASSNLMKYHMKQQQLKDAQETNHSNHNNNSNKYKTRSGRKNNYQQKQEQQSAMDKKLRGRLLTEFHRVIEEAHSAVGRNKGSVVPSGLLSAVVARNRRFAGRRQQDSHELLRVLVEGMRDQNEKILRKERESRLYRNLATWTMEDIIAWFAFYGIDFAQSYARSNKEEENDDGQKDEQEEVKLDISVQEFSDFIKAPKKFGIDKFFSKIGLDKKRDAEFASKFSKARVYLVNEECDFYCNKHGYELIPAAQKHESKKKSKQRVGHIHDNEQKQTNKIKTIIDDVFCGEIQSCVTCYGCGEVSRTTEEFYDLSLPISVPASSGYGGGYGNVWFRKAKKSKKKDRWSQSNKQSKQQQKQQKKKGGKKGKGSKKGGNKQSDKEEVEEAEEEEKDVQSKQDTEEAETKQDEKEDEEEEKKAKYVPEPLPATRGMDRLKGNDVDVMVALAAFTDPELLEGSDKYGCKECTRMHLQEKRKKGELQAFVQSMSNNGNGKQQQNKNKKKKKQQSAKQDDVDKQAEEENAGNMKIVVENLDANKEEEEEQRDEEEEEEEQSEENEDGSANDGNEEEKAAEEEQAEEDEDAFSVEEEKRDEIEQLLEVVPLIRHNAKKQILISKPPPVLVLHLKRFEQQGFRLSKVGKSVRFPLHLDLTPYLTQECKQQHTYTRRVGVAKQTENAENDGDVNKPEAVEYEEVAETKCMYQLYGISVHHGSMGGGHYIAYTHKHRSNGPKDGWYYFSDSSYKSVTYQEVMRAQAYVLFYQKCDNNANDVDGSHEEQ